MGSSTFDLSNMAKKKSEKVLDAKSIFNQKLAKLENNQNNSAVAPNSPDAKEDMTMRSKSTVSNRSHLNKEQLN